MKKNKTGHGGARPGAGGGCRWKHGRTKLVRLPVALVDKILEVARYMDQNEGRLPLPDSVVILPADYPAQSLSSEERKELFAKQKARRLAEQVMLGDEQV
ncbi:MAG TPA: hypothetical protein VIQ31_10990 [Phormidium sp.]